MPTDSSNWHDILTRTGHALSARGYVANAVIGLVLLLLGPIAGGLLNSKRAGIIGAALAGTIVVWLVAITMLRQLPRPSSVPAVIASPGPAVSSPLPTPAASPVPEPSPTGPARAPRSTTVPKPPQQHASITHSSGATLYQAGRDITVINPIAVQTPAPPVVSWRQEPTETLWGTDAPHAVLVTVTTDQPLLGPHFIVVCTAPIVRKQFNIGRLGSMSSDLPSADPRVYEFVIASPPLTPSVPLTIYLGALDPIAVSSVERR